MGIKNGDFLPEIVLPDQTGRWVDVKKETAGKNLVIYFYPKDDTPGCTRQACSFRDQYADFEDAGAVVIGISAQSPESHRNFAEKHHLAFTLLSDMDNQTRKQFGVPSDLFGLIPGRVTYIADKNGKVVHIFNSQIQVSKHVEEAIKILRQLL